MILDGNVLAYVSIKVIRINNDLRFYLDNEHSLVLYLPIDLRGVRKFLFRGSFAEVRKALYIEDGSPFAIKCIDKYASRQLGRRSARTTSKSI